MGGRDAVAYMICTIMTSTCESTQDGWLNLYYTRRVMIATCNVAHGRDLLFGHRSYHRAGIPLNCSLGEPRIPTS